MQPAWLLWLSRLFWLDKATQNRQKYILSVYVKLLGSDRYRLKQEAIKALNLFFYKFQQVLLLGFFLINESCRRLVFRLCDLIYSDTMTGVDFYV